MSFDVRHGMPSGYAAGCRCDRCMAAKRTENQIHDAKRRAKAGRLGPLLAHGKASTYRHYGCRCEPCTAAKAAERTASRARKPAPVILRTEPTA